MARVSCSVGCGFKSREPLIVVKSVDCHQFGTVPMKRPNKEIYDGKHIGTKSNFYGLSRDVS